ncbi:unnamed protein product [Urochloa humidicola]
MAAPSSDLPDEVLEEIFIRLNDAADLARASAACASFRRVVSGRRFLRRVRSHHAPPVLGFLYGSTSPGFLPAGSPRGAAPADRALARAADFAFSFLPGNGRWRVRDARDGRILLSSGQPSSPTSSSPTHCTAGTCRSPASPTMSSPPSPTSTCTPSSPSSIRPATRIRKRQTPEILPFRVICNVLSETKVATFIFSSATGEWRGVTSFSFRSYGAIRHPGPGSLVRHYASRCFYWTHDSWNYLLVLDTSEMKFSVAGLPSNSHGRRRVIFHAGEDMLGLLTLAKQSLEFHWKTLGGSGFGVEEWHHEKTIPLPDCYRYTILDASEGYLLLRMAPRLLSWYVNSSQQMPPESQYFTLELKTMVAERLCSSNQTVCHAGAHLYASFPPPLSLPSV